MSVLNERPGKLLGGVFAAFVVLATIAIAGPAVADNHHEGHKYLCSSQYGRYLDADGERGNSGRYNVSTSANPTDDDVWEIAEMGSGVYTLRNKQKRTYLDSDGSDKAYNVDGSLRVAADDKWEIRDIGDGKVALFNIERQRYLNAEGAGADWNVNTTRTQSNSTRWQILDTDEDCMRMPVVVPTAVPTPVPTAVPAPTPGSPISTPVPSPTPGSPISTPVPSPTPGSPISTPVPSPTPDVPASIRVAWRNVALDSRNGQTTATMRVVAASTPLTNATFVFSSDSAATDSFDLEEADPAITCTELAGADAGNWSCTGLTVAAGATRDIVFTVVSTVAAAQTVAVDVPGATSMPGLGVPGLP